jgi:SAM-dependent methyltransferase
MKYPALSLGAWFRYDFIFEHLIPENPRSIVEFGPGLGAFGVRLADHATYEAVEPDADSRCAAQYLLGTRVKASPDELTIDKADVICAFEVLEHLPDDGGALRTWTKHLRPGGLVLVSVPAFMSQFGPHDEVAGHLRRYSPQEMDELFRQSGLETVELRLTGFPAGFFLQWARNRLAARHSGRLGTVQARTAASGRLYQFESNGWLTHALAWPFRKLQRLPVHRGTGLVAAARKP